MALPSRVATSSRIQLIVRGALGAILDHLGQVAPLGVAQWREHPVVDGEQVELRQPGEQPGLGAVGAADGQLVQQARHADVARGEAAAARPLDEGAAEKALSDPGRADQDQVVALGDPRARPQRLGGYGTGRPAAATGWGRRLGSLDADTRASAPVRLEVSGARHLFWQGRVDHRVSLLG